MRLKKHFYACICMLLIGIGSLQAKEVTLTEAGTLSGMISNEELNSLTELTVNGPVNGSDIKIIRAMGGTLMNQKAAELGMKNTHFTNATGLTDTEHYSSAADMAKLLQAALHNTTFRTIFTTKHYTTTATAQHPEGVSLTSTLLGKLDGTELPTGTQIEGGKTGYTAAAGLCLASLATVNGKEYILVTLAAPGDHGTEQYNIRDAVHVYQKLADKK